VRAYAVGAPATGLLQLLVGASRPGESSAGSDWKPYQDDNGVSGHAFVGAIPFIVAAKKCDSLLWKSAFYFGSTLTAYSRVYDDKHYMSQAIMGWCVAYLAVEATECTARSCAKYRVIPASVNGWPGMAVEYRF
jgi:membrane-associated phospholipid phosphatase